MADRSGEKTQASKRPPEGSKDPQVRFGDSWMPAHQVWSKMNVAAEVADTIERFNERYPGLSTPTTREIVPVVRQRLKDIAVHMPKKDDAGPDVGEILSELLTRLPPEEAVEQLREETGEPVSVRELISLVGEDAYLKALVREADEYRANSILPEQTARIWNDLGRPAPGGGLWSTQKIEQMLAQSS